MMFCQSAQRVNQIRNVIAIWLFCNFRKASGASALNTTAPAATARKPKP